MNSLNINKNTAKKITNKISRVNEGSLKNKLSLKTINFKNYFYNFYFATTYLKLRVTDDMNSEQGLLLSYLSLSTTKFL